MLSQVYSNIRNPGSFSSVQALSAEANVSVEKAKRYLSSTKTYRKFRPKGRQSHRAKIKVHSIGHIFQSDLFVLQDISWHNNGNKYIVLVVDCFSHRIWAKAIKRKTGLEVSQSLNQIFSEIEQDNLKTPVSLLGTDLGQEYWNQEANAVYEKHKVYHFALRSPLKASMAELHGKLLLNRLSKFMHFNESKRWIDNLQDCVHALNKRKLKRLNHKTPESITFQNQNECLPFIKNYQVNPVYKFEIGDKINVEKSGSTFAKARHGIWDVENVFTITARHKHENGAHRYTLSDGDDSISGTFYASELQKVPNEENTPSVNV